MNDNYTQCAPCGEAGSAVLAAGTACVSGVCGYAGAGGQSGLAQINFPVQKYVEGFCPCAALANGTLFPELVL